jgi:hypothetical protein
MISDSQLDSVLRSALREDANRAIGSSNVAGKVRARMAHTIAKDSWSVRRAKVLVSVMAATLALSVGGVALAAETGLIRIHWVQAPLNGQGTPIDMTVSNPYETTVLAAEAKLGFHVQTLDGYAAAKTPVTMPDGRTQSVVFHPPVTAINGKSVAHNTGAVALYYTVSGDRIEIVEQMDPNGSGPLDVTLKQFEQPVPGLSKAAVERLGGAEYLVFRSPSNSAIVVVEWKTPGGVLMRINCGSQPLSTDAVLSLIQHLH